MHLKLVCNRQTNGRTDQPTNIATYRAAIAAKNVQIYAPQDKFCCTLLTVHVDNGLLISILIKFMSFDYHIDMLNFFNSHDMYIVIILETVEK